MVFYKWKLSSTQQLGHSGGEGDGENINIRVTGSGLEIGRSAVTRTDPGIDSALRPGGPRIVERRYFLPFILVASLFLSWALAASLNDVLIRHFQMALDLTRGQSSLIQLAFYIGYFCAALPAGLVIGKIGYKGGILVGLALYAVGAFAFYPAAAIRSYGAFLLALYIIAFGLAFLETSANPYVAMLGDSATGSARLNLAQSAYGLGAVAGPIVGGLLIFSGVERTPQQLRSMPPAAAEALRSAAAATVQLPYVCIGLAVCALAIAIALTRFPDWRGEAASSALGRTSPFRVLRHRRLRWAVVAEFFYVGAQVGIWSFFIDFCKDTMPALKQQHIAFLLSGSLATLMVGRFTGAFIQRRFRPAAHLALYAAINILLCIIASYGSGVVAIGALWSTSFFMSIMFPTIFALGVEDLRGEAQLASSFLIMSIIGGALIPPAMGLLADKLGGAQHIMVVPALCFAVCLWFALRLPPVETRA
jgi:MFS transporter, FHS family, L-fucose permease